MFDPETPAACAIRHGKQRRQPEIRIGGLHPAAALAARPVVFIIKPEGGEAERLGFFDDRFTRIEPFVAHIRKLAAGTRINQVLRDSAFAQLPEPLPDELARRTAGDRPHRNQWTLHHLQLPCIVYELIFDGIDICHLSCLIARQKAAPRPAGSLRQRLRSARESHNLLGQRRFLPLPVAPGERERRIGPPRSIPDRDRNG